MSASVAAAPSEAPPISPLMLADRLLTMAQDADRAGYAAAAARLVTAMFDILECRKTAQP